MNEVENKPPLLNFAADFYASAAWATMNLFFEDGLSRIPNLPPSLEVQQLDIPQILSLHQICKEEKTLWMDTNLSSTGSPSIAPEMISKLMSSDNDLFETTKSQEGANLIYNGIRDGNDVTTIGIKELSNTEKMSH